MHDRSTVALRGESIHRVSINSFFHNAAKTIYDNITPKTVYLSLLVALTYKAI